MMWWTILACVIGNHVHIALLQPVLNEENNVRHTRQLDFGECCPCPGSTASQKSAVFTGSSLDGSRGLDECPCRLRDADPDGASSIFFPSAIHANGPFMKASEAKEDMKPLLHPEVDLASSVLQTLREVTDEEYEDALARDAARNAMKEAVGQTDSVFRDAIPEESAANLVTIIVNPKLIDSEDEIMPQASHIQESRCIHPPLGSARTNLGKMRATSNSQNVLRDIFKLPKTRNSKLLHRNLMGTDSSVGASNIQSRVVKPDWGELRNREYSDLRTHNVQRLKLKPIVTSTSNIDCEDNFQASNSKHPLLRSLLKYPLGKLRSDSLMFEAREAENPTLIPLMSKLRIGNPISENEMGPDIFSSSSNNNDQLSKTPSTIFKETPNLKLKTGLDYIFNSSKPVNLKSLLKLKDIELIPLRIRNQNEQRSSFLLNDKSDEAIPDKLERSQESLSPNKQKDYLRDRIVQPEECVHNSGDDMDTRQNVQVLSIIKSNNTNEPMEKLVSNPSDFDHHINDEDSNECDDLSVQINHMSSRANEDSFGSNFTNSPLREPFVINDLSNVTESNDNSTIINDLRNSLDSEQQASSGNAETPGCDLNNSDRNNEISDNDLFNVNENNTNTNNDNENVSRVNQIEENEEEKITDKHMIPEESSIHEQTQNKTNFPFVETPTVRGISSKSRAKLDETLLTIKENIQTKLNELKSRIVPIKDPTNITKQDARLSSHDNTDISDIENEKGVSDCLEKSYDEFTHKSTPKESENSGLLTMTDLKKMSDSMLQKEEQLQGPKNALCDDNIELNTDMTPSKSSPEITESFELVDDNAHTISSEKSDTDNNNLKNTCSSDRVQPEIDLSRNLDDENKIVDEVQKVDEEMDVGASNRIMNNLPQPRELATVRSSNFELPSIDDNVELRPSLDSLNLINNPLPSVRDILKLDPLPILENIKLKLPNIFNTNDRDALEDELSTEVSCNAEPSDLKSTMATDASTSDLQIKLPPFRSAAREKLNLGTLQLPLSDFARFSTGNIAENLRYKPPKLQSTLFKIDNIPITSLVDSPRISENSLKKSFTEDLSRKVTNLLGTKENNLKTGMRLNAQDELRLQSQGRNRVGKLKSTIFSIDLADRIKSHADNTLKTIQDTFKTAENDINLFKNSVKTPDDVLGFLRYSHPDARDGFRTVYANDRLGLMRTNSLPKKPKQFDRSKSNINTPSLTKSKDRTSPNLLARNEPDRLMGSSRNIGNQRKFNMPAAASVPIPKTVDVPMLKKASTHTNTPSPQKVSSAKPNISNARHTQLTAKSTSVVEKQNDNKRVQNLGRKQINPFKSSKFTVSFSTTPRPVNLRKKNSNLLKSSIAEMTLKASPKNRNTFRLGSHIEDSNGALSETKSTIQSPNSSESQFKRFNADDVTNLTNKLRTKPISFQMSKNANIGTKKALKEGEIELSPFSKKPTNLQSWPDTTGSRFLSKVNEAVRANLPQPKTEFPDKTSDLLKDSRDSNSYTSDMARSASEVTGLDRAPLEENVTYKCRMVCNRE